MVAPNDLFIYKIYINICIYNAERLQLKKKSPPAGKRKDFILLQRVYKHCVHHKVQRIIEIACLQISMYNLSEAHEILESIDCMKKTNT